MFTVSKKGLRTFLISVSRMQKSGLCSEAMLFKMLSLLEEHLSPFG